MNGPVRSCLNWAYLYWELILYRFQRRILNTYIYYLLYPQFLYFFPPAVHSLTKQDTGVFIMSTLRNRLLL